MSNNIPKITFWGGVGSVTGANFSVVAGETKFLVDCGLLQGTPQAPTINKEDFPYDPKEYKALFITHSHIDHIGRIPKLVKDGFAGTIYSTPETKALAEFMLEDASKIMEEDARLAGILPLYNPENVKKSFELWKGIPYHKETKISDSVSVILRDAGHVLGSSMYLFTLSGGEGETVKILFTGDLGNSPSALLPDTEYVTDANYIVMDSVYGDRNHESKEDREKKFKEIVIDTIARKGTIIIPAFSLERTQTILYELNNLIEDHVISSIPVFLDSPLAIKLTTIYEHSDALFNVGVRKEISGGDKIFNFPKLKITARSEDSRHIASTPDPKIIIAGSGMSTGGRILHHEIRYLPDPNATVLLMGYEAVGTLGREIEEGAKEVMINGMKIPVHARIVKIDGYSAHKDSDHLIDFVEHASEGPLKQVFVVMGEPKASLFLTQRLRDYIGVKAIAPERGKEYEIS
jgi:metallo-beta-lactamase family protein